MNNQFDMNKFNTLISQASDAILCNSECRNQREADNLKQNYLNSQTNLASASNQVQASRAIDFRDIKDFKIFATNI